MFISAQLSSMCQLMIKAKKPLVEINSERWAYDTHNFICTLKSQSAVNVCHLLTA